MVSFTLRSSRDSDDKALDALKRETYQATATKAIWQAVREYPGLLAEVRELKGKLSALQTAVDNYCRAKQAVDDATDRAGMAWGDLQSNRDTFGDFQRELPMRHNGVPRTWLDE